MIDDGLYREFQIFIKPVGPSCNLDCSYCYYLDRKQLFSRDKPMRMGDELLESYIRQHMEASTEPVISFSWHGGEPLLAGLDFFRRAVVIQNKWKPPGRNIINGIQTNGTLLDDEWCRFLAEEHFMVGISMDGPEELHNMFRTTKNGNATFRQVLHGYDRLLLHGIDPEILCVVNAINVKHSVLIYRYFKRLGAKYISFLPLVERRPDEPSGVSAISVPAQDFGNFLCAVFDEWVQQDIGKVKIQIIEEVLRTSFNQEHTLCIFKPVCGGVPVLEHNGDFYSCDHYVNKDHLIGNLKDISLYGLLDGDGQKAFGRAKQLTLPRYCLDCEVRPMCNGECPKNRFIDAPTGAPGLNYLCAGYYAFFTHCRPLIDMVARVYTSQNDCRGFTKHKTNRDSKK